MVRQMAVRMDPHSVGLMVDQMVGQKADHLAGLTAEHWVDWKAG